jgi:hypothetical protein
MASCAGRSLHAAARTLGVGGRRCGVWPAWEESVQNSGPPKSLEEMPKHLGIEVPYVLLVGRPQMMLR